MAKATKPTGGGCTLPAKKKLQSGIKASSLTWGGDHIQSILASLDDGIPLSEAKQMEKDSLGDEIGRLRSIKARNAPRYSNNPDGVDAEIKELTDQLREIDGLTDNDFRVDPHNHDKGQLYEVEIPEDGDMLLWDKPLSEQPASVRKILSKEWGSNQTGESFYKEKALSFGKGGYWKDAGYKPASEYLSSLGIKGIKYPAEAPAFSRSPPSIQPGSARPGIRRGSKHRGCHHRALGQCAEGCRGIRHERPGHP
jgi:hypothetical protein